MPSAGSSARPGVHPRTVMTAAGGITDLWPRFAARAGALATLIAVLTGLNACDANRDASAREADHSPHFAEGGQGLTPPDSHAADIARPLSETDRLMLDQAAIACQSPGADGYVSFFDAFIRSAAVRSRYSSAAIEVILDRGNGSAPATRKVPAREYRDFPILMEDDYRRPARSADRDEYVEVVFNQSSSNRISVEWTRVRYVGPSEGGDDRGTPVTAEGRPYDPEGKADGQLLFAPNADCWELVADIRFLR